MTPQLIHTVIHIFESVFTVVALVFTYRAYDSAPARTTRDLIRIIEELDETVVGLEGKQKKLNANYALLLAREKSNNKKPEVDEDSVDTSLQPGENLIDYKRRMRKLIAQGKLRHGEE